MAKIPEIPDASFARYGEMHSFLGHNQLSQAVHWGLPNLTDHLNRLPAGLIKHDGSAAEIDKSLDDVKDVALLLSSKLQNFAFAQLHRRKTGSTIALMPKQLVDPEHRDKLLTETGQWYAGFMAYFRRTATGDGVFKLRYPITIGIRRTILDRNGDFKNKDGIELFIGHRREVVMSHSLAESFRESTDQFIRLNTTSSVVGDSGKAEQLRRTAGLLWNQVISNNLIFKGPIDGHPFPQLQP